MLANTIFKIIIFILSWIPQGIRVGEKYMTTKYCKHLEEKLIRQYKKQILTFVRC